MIFRPVFQSLRKYSEISSNLILDFYLFIELSSGLTKSSEPYFHAAI